MTTEPTSAADAMSEPNELDELIAATGNSFYDKPFEKFAYDGHISISWNWAASFFGMYWLFRRNMVAYGLIYLAAGYISLALLPPWLSAYVSLSHAFGPKPVATWDIAYRVAFSVASVVVFPVLCKRALLHTSTPSLASTQACHKLPWQW